MNDHDREVADLEARIEVARRDERAATLTYLDAVVAERLVKFEHAERVRDAAARLAVSALECDDPEAPALAALREFHEAELRQAASAFAHAEQVRDAYARFRAVAEGDRHQERTP
jgi:hypothetical protein